jgi:hypothetical protein
MLRTNDYVACLAVSLPIKDLMARTSASASPAASVPFPQLLGWADAIGSAIGQGIARGLNSSLNAGGVVGAPALGPRKRGRPAKPFVGFVPVGQRCSVAGCGKPARAKGMCSAHYQASRRKRLAKA